MSLKRLLVLLWNSSIIQAPHSPDLLRIYSMHLCSLLQGFASHQPEVIMPLAR